MTFADYNPDRAVTFWEKMERQSAGQREPPEILSTHPHHAKRLAQIERWLPGVKGAYDAYRKGKVVTRRREPGPRLGGSEHESIARIRHPSRGE